MAEPREIKFRAYNKKDKRFYYFDLETVTKTIYVGYYHPITGEKDCELDDYSLYSEKQLYTGLKDKNGKEIYEGDILARRAGYNNPEIVRKGTVEFINGKYECSVYYIHKQRLYLFEVASNWEVSGNIYENPGLLEVKN